MESVGGIGSGAVAPQSETSLEEAAQEFEMLVMQQLFRRANEASSRWSSLLDKGHGSKLYRGLFMEEVVGRAVAQRSLGLADRLVAQHGDDQEGRND